MLILCRVSSSPCALLSFLLSALQVLHIWTLRTRLLPSVDLTFLTRECSEAGTVKMPEILSGISWILHHDYEPSLRHLFLWIDELFHPFTHSSIPLVTSEASFAQHLLRVVAGRLAGRRRWLSSHGASCISVSPLSFKAKSSDFSPQFFLDNREDFLCTYYQEFREWEGGKTFTLVFFIFNLFIYMIKIIKMPHCSIIHIILKENITLKEPSYYASIQNVIRKRKPHFLGQSNTWHYSYFTCNDISDPYV